MLNTVTRRDAGFQTVVRALCTGHNRLPSAHIREVIGRIDSRFNRDDAIITAIEALFERDSADQVCGDEELALLLEAKNITNAVTRCKALARGLSILEKAANRSYEGARSELEDHLLQSWKAIDIGWLRIRVGFEIAELLAVHSESLSTSYLILTEELRARITGLADQNAAKAYLQCVSLAVRAFAGLVPRRVYSQQDIELLAVLIDVIPGAGERAMLWSELAIRCAVHGNNDLCSDIVNERVRPLLSAIPSRDIQYKQFVVARVAPALYVANGQGALGVISELDVKYRDAAYAAIVSFLFRNQDPNDPVDYTSGAGYAVTYSTLLKICEVIRQIDSDARVYDNVETIIDCVLSKKNEGLLTISQKEEIIRQLREIVSSQFPNQRHITHQGYKVIGRAQLSRFRTDPDVEDLVASAEKIDNTADRALVLFTTGLALLKTSRSRGEELIRRGRGLAARIPADWDRIERLIGFAHEAKPVSPSTSRQVLEDAIRTIQRMARGYGPSLRRIVDLAHRIEPAFAKTLVDKLENETFQKDARRQLGLLELKQKLADEKPAYEELQLASSADYQYLGSMLLSSLQSERMNGVRPQFVRPCIESAARQPLVESYYVLAWIIANSIDRHASTNHAGYNLRPVFEAAIAGAELAGQLAAKSFEVLRDARESVRLRSESTDDVIDVYDRGQAIRYVKSWLEQNAKGAVLVCDPFFGPDELTILQLVRAVNPSCRVEIITGRPASPPPDGQLWEDYVAARWADLSEQSPPSTRITMVGSAVNGDCPIQITCLLSGEVGLDLGTSFRSMGIERAPTFRNMSLAEVDEVRELVEAVTVKSFGEWRGTRLRISSFTL